MNNLTFSSTNKHRLIVLADTRLQYLISNICGFFTFMMTGHMHLNNEHHTLATLSRWHEYMYMYMHMCIFTRHM